MNNCTKIKGISNNGKIISNNNKIISNNGKIRRMNKKIIRMNSKSIRNRENSYLILTYQWFNKTKRIAIIIKIIMIISKIYKV